MLCPSDNGRGSRFEDSGGNWARGNYGYNAFEFWPNQYLWPMFFTDPFPKPIYKVNMGMGGFNLAWRGTRSKSLSLAKIVDGTTHTIALAEMCVGLSPRDRRGVWAMGMCGSNFHCRHAANGINSCSGYDDDLFGSATVISDVGDGNLLGRVYASRQQCRRQRSINGPQPTSGRRHVAMADGSVHFLTDFIDTGNMPIGANITAQQWNDPNVFRTWQRLLVSGDAYSIETSF